MSIAIGVARIALRLPENHSLKGKRQVVKSLIARLHNKFNVAAAEVDTLDSWQIITLAVACVANEEGHAHRVLASIVSFTQSERPDLELIDYSTEIIRADPRSF